MVHFTGFGEYSSTCIQWTDKCAVTTGGDLIQLPVAWSKTLHNSSVQ